MGACNPGDTLILPRNSHKSAISAMVLSGVVPKYIFPDYDNDWDIPIAISPSQVKQAIQELKSDGLKLGAIFITSPTYHGICTNLREISSLCHLQGIPLIVDEAHGAHFGFHPYLPLSALQQGADVVVQSTHKVLSSLTQSSMLHISGNLIDAEKISRRLQNLQTTSPSSLLLASLDATTAQLKENPATIFDNAINLAIEAKNAIKQIPGISIYDFPDIDPLRVTVGFFNFQLSGYEVNDFLFKDQSVLSELPGSRFITIPITPGTCREHVDRLILGFKHLSSSFIRDHHTKSGIEHIGFNPWIDIKMQLTPREAFFAKKKRVDIKDAIGKVCGELICPHPPGIPVMCPGEVISERALDILVQSKVDGAKVTGACDTLNWSILICDI